MPTWLGIDIGNRFVRVASVRTSYRRCTLESLVAVERTGEREVAEIVRDAVEQALGRPIGGEGVAVSLPGTRSACHVVELPRAVQKQLADVLPFELESQLPFEMDDAIFDHRVLAAKPVAEGEEPSDQIRVLAVVARTDDVRSLVGDVKGWLGIEPERVSVGGFPLVSFAPTIAQKAEPGPIVIVDLGTKSSDFIVIEDGQPVFARTLSQGTDGLPQSASKLARELRVSIAAFRARGGKPPVGVWLSGGGAFVSGAESFLSAELEVPVSLVPTPEVEHTIQPESRLSEVPAFAKSIGLALSVATRDKMIDLRRGPLAYERGYGWLREKIPPLVAVGAVLGISLLFTSVAKLIQLSNERATLEEALGVVTQEVLGESTTSSARARTLTAKQAKASGEDPLPHADGFDVMVRLSEDIPQSMVHDIEELDLQKGHVIIHGIVGSIPDAQSIAKTLETEKCFSDVKITRTNQVVGGDRQKYVLEFDLKCPEDRVASGTKKKKKRKKPKPTEESGGAGEN